jgi:hypothetical protein
MNTTDPTEWLKRFINNTAINLMYPIDCNYEQSNGYPLDALAPNDIMNAWSIFYNTTAFNDFWNKVQQEYQNHVPATWYKYFQNQNQTDFGYGYDSASESNATSSHYKHIADLMVYMGAQTQLDDFLNSVENTTNYGLNVFNQNYNEDYRKR